MLRTVLAHRPLSRHAHQASSGQLWRFLSSSAVSPELDDQNTPDVDVPPLVELENAVLGYPSSSLSQQQQQRQQQQHVGLNLSILPATEGGHALLGRNGVGKSLISNALASHGSADYLWNGSFITDKPWHSSTAALVSFESHEALLQKGGTVSKTISQGGKLSKAAQFLIVRFGLYPLLHRQVETLSTGEIRKVLLVQALADRPRLLILDNAFDGLDVASRENLKDLVSKTILGFRPDILVQAVSAQATAHTQVLLMTHRPEEIVDEIATVSRWNTDSNISELETSVRQERSGTDLLHAALGIDDTAIDNLQEPWDDPTLPSRDEIAAIWNIDRDNEQQPTNEDALVHAESLSVRRGEDATLIDNLDWTVMSGERWLVAGGNGAGKSTLSRLLANNTSMADIDDGSLVVSTTSASTNNDDEASVNDFQRRDGVGWVSTELHLSMARSTNHTVTVQQVLERNGQTPPEIAAKFASFLQLVQDSNDDDDSLMMFRRPFAELSQGQQKLVLIASALASRPKLLILDEPSQGLDLIHRNRVLGLCERVCQATDMSLVYITHHLEELIPSVSKILHLDDGKSIYTGSRDDYDPDRL